MNENDLIEAGNLKMNLTNIRHKLTNRNDLSIKGIICTYYKKEAL